MSGPILLSPDHVLSEDDPGDETARRYRFQFEYAAIICCAVLDETQDVTEVFCEHFEDVLLKHADDTYTGAQVKTRETDQPPWKAGDDQVVASFARFVRLEKQFPGKFRSLRFLTNHFLFVAKSAQSLLYVLEQIGVAATPDNLPAVILRWLRKVARAADASEALTFAVLKKCEAKDDLPKLADCMMRLIDTLVGTWEGAHDCVHETVRRSAAALATECSHASSLAHEQLLPGYLSAVGGGTSELTVRIEGKRMTPARIRLALEVGRDSKAPLRGASETQPEPGEGSSELLTKKLDAGGFSAVSRMSAENLRDKAEFLAITWQKRLGRTTGLERYDHIRTIAWSDAARAFEATKTEDGNFGPEMREELRTRFHLRRRDGDQLYDCSDDHLEGFVYTLTSACKVQWSLRLPWEED